MPKYIIERNIPGAGDRKDNSGAVNSNKVLKEMNDEGKNIHWQHSYSTQDKIYCVYIADSPDLVLEHAKRLGAPADKIEEIKGISDPTTGEWKLNFSSKKEALDFK